MDKTFPPQKVNLTQHGLYVFVHYSSSKLPLPTSKVFKKLWHNNCFYFNCSHSSIFSLFGIFYFLRIVGGGVYSVTNRFKKIVANAWTIFHIVLLFIWFSFVTKISGFVKVDVKGYRQELKPL